MKLNAVLLMLLVVSSVKPAWAQPFDDTAAVAAPVADLSLRSHDDWPLEKDFALNLSPRAHDDWAVAAF